MTTTCFATTTGVLFSLSLADIHRSRAVRLPASGRGRAGGASAPKLSASTRGVRSVAIVRAAPTHPVHENVCMSRGLLARGRTFLDSDRSVRPLQGPGVGAVCFRHIRRRGTDVPVDGGSAFPNGTGRQRSRDLCAGSLMFQHIDAAQLLALPKSHPNPFWGREQF